MSYCLRGSASLWMNKQKNSFTATLTFMLYIFTVQTDVGVTDWSYDRLLARKIPCEGSPKHAMRLAYGFSYWEPKNVEKMPWPHKFEQLVTTCCYRLRESFRYGPSHCKVDSHFHYNFIFQRHMVRMWYSAGETGIARLLLGNVFWHVSLVSFSMFTDKQTPQEAGTS